jgi:hypothetical protein
MIVQDDPHPVERIADLPRYLDVRLRRVRIITRVVVHHDQRRGIER